MRVRAENRFYGLYDKHDKCIGVYESIAELVNFMQKEFGRNLTDKSFIEQTSRYLKTHEEPIERTLEKGKLICSQRIYKNLFTGNTDYEYSGCSVYKFWEEEIA